MKETTEITIEKEIYWKGKWEAYTLSDSQETISSISFKNTIFYF